MFLDTYFLQTAQIIDYLGVVGHGFRKLGKNRARKIRTTGGTYSVSRSALST